MESRKKKKEKMKFKEIFSFVCPFFSLILIYSSSGILLSASQQTRHSWKEKFTCFIGIQLRKCDENLVQCLFFFSYNSKVNMPSMFRDYLECVVGPNQTIQKKAAFQNAYLTALSGKKDLRALTNDTKTVRGPVAERIMDKNYKYQTIIANTYGLTPRRLTAKQQRGEE